VAEAAELLGVNVVTIRRMIKRGQLEAERVHRPQGSAYLVTLPQHGTGDGTPTEQPAQDMSRTHGAATPAPAEAMVSLIQTTIATVLGPLVGQVEASRQTIERQAETIAELREERGRHAAELERAASTIVALGEENDRLRAAQGPVAGQQAASDAGMAPGASTPSGLAPGASSSVSGRMVVALALVAVPVLAVLLAASAMLLSGSR
jgi:excisionase family DNA binding protein